jgi:hypothetical protein
MNVVMMAHASGYATLVMIALVVGLGAWLFARRNWGSARMRLLIAVAAGGIGFQIFHVVEHVAQVVYWVVHPTALPWLTPWAVIGADALAELTDGHRGSGVELLHLVGNLIFLAGLAAAVRIVRAQRRPGTRPLRVALWVQTAHVAEHVLLTVTWLATGRALGVTTAFGSLASLPSLEIALRVWLHFAINLVATVVALRGLHAARHPGHMHAGVRAEASSSR